LSKGEYLMTSKSDFYASMVKDAADPAVGAAAIVAGEDQEVFPRALFVGTGGDLAVEMMSGDEVVFKNVPNGTLLPIRVRKVLVAGTTAANILGLY
jgi:hypothetical protein